MIEIWRAKFFIGCLLTTIAVTLSYEVKVTFIVMPASVLVLFSFVISSYLASAVVNFALGAKAGRKLIMGKSWIEGHWYLSTVYIDGTPNPISQGGLVYICYQGEDYVLSVITYRKKIDNMHTGFSSISDLVSIRPSDIRFSNIFAISNGTIETRGVTTGKFFNDGSGLHPNKFEGNVVLFNEGINRRQSATKISDKIVKKLMKEKGEQWKEEILDNYTLITTPENS